MAKLRNYGGIMRLDKCGPDCFCFAVPSDIGFHFGRKFSVLVQDLGQDHPYAAIFLCSEEKSNVGFHDDDSFGEEVRFTFHGEQPVENLLHHLFEKGEA